MAGHTVDSQSKSTFQKWFGPNRNTHWSIAGAVAVIVLGGYLIYSNREVAPTIVVPMTAVEQPPPPTATAPPKSER
jgi:hypothetical protein